MEKFLKQFGGKVTKELISYYEKSPNWREGAFHNLEATSLSINVWDVPELIYKQIANRKKREPVKPIPVAAFEPAKFLEESQTPQFIWYGHSVLLFRLNGKTILIDPMLGPDCAPIAPTNNKRYSENTLNFISDFPEIDLLLLSHDHYDHLDMASINKLKGKVREYYVALGVKRHLVRWGVAPELVTEFDWWDAADFRDIKITYTPTRHFSGRGLKDRAQSLWGGWVFISENSNIWFSGDGGYGSHFKEIGKKLGPFDFAFMECGQYNQKWHQIHMFPNESVQAALDAGVKAAMPVHWGAFTLAQHNWEEPVENFIEEAKMQGLDYFYIRPGVVQQMGEVNDVDWWKEYVFKA